MKIIYLVHQFFPEYRTGTENFVLNSALMAQKFGNNVKVITYSFYENSFYDNESHGILYKEFFYEGIPVVAFKYRENPANINLVLNNDLLSGFAQTVLKIESPDIIHAGHPMRVHELIWAAQDLAIPYVITLTDFFLLCPKVNLTPSPTLLCSGPENGDACSVLCPEFNKDFIRNRLNNSKKVLTKANSIISPSKFVANIFLKEFPSLDIQTIPHGIRYSHIKKNNRQYHQGDQIIFGYIGNLIYHKGVHIMLDAFINISGSNIMLKIFGFGQEKFMQELKEIVSNDTRITFEGIFKAENLGHVFNQIDVLIIPTLCYETYSFVLHEALACNVPVLASNLGVLQEEIQDGYNGINFIPGNSINLQQKMKQLIDAPDTLNKMKENIQKYIIVPKLEQEAYHYRGIYNKIFDSL